MLRIPKRKFDTRERVLLGVAGIVAIVIVFMQVQGPLEAYSLSGTQVKSAQNRLTQVRLWSQEIKQAQAEREALRAQFRENPVNLYTFVNQTVGKLGLESRCSISQRRTVTGTDSELASVDVQFKGTNLEELVNFLHTLNDNGSGITLHQLRQFRPALDGNGLDLQLTLISPAL